MWQGDSLSYLLFCIVKEVLSGSSPKAKKIENLKLMLYCIGMDISMHVLYEYDIMIFLCKNELINNNIRDNFGYHL